MVMDRYLSQIAVKEIFPAGQKVIESSSIVVVGVGGIGSAVAEMLVRMGIKNITIVDDDLIENSNLNRQAMFKESDIGLKKVDVARAELLRIDEEISINVIDQKLSFYNAEDILSQADIIMDGTDNYNARNVLNVVSFNLKKPWIFSAVEGTYGYVKAIIPGRTSCLSCFGYPDKGEGISCTIQGVIPSAVRAIASIAVTTAVKVLLEKEMTGDLLYLDVWKPSLEIMSIPRNDSCKVCGERRL